MAVLSGTVSQYIYYLNGGQVRNIGGDWFCFARHASNNSFNIYKRNPTTTDWDFVRNLPEALTPAGLSSPKWLCNVLGDDTVVLLMPYNISAVPEYSLVLYSYNAATDTIIDNGVVLGSGEKLHTSTPMAHGATSADFAVVGGFKYRTMGTDYNSLGEALKVSGSWGAYAQISAFAEQVTNTVAVCVERPLGVIGVNLNTQNPTVFSNGVAAIDTTPTDNAYVGYTGPYLYTVPDSESVIYNAINVGSDQVNVWTTPLHASYPNTSITRTEVVPTWTLSPSYSTRLNMVAFQVATGEEYIAVLWRNTGPTHFRLSIYDFTGVSVPVHVGDIWEDTTIHGGTHFSTGLYFDYGQNKLIFNVGSTSSMEIYIVDVEIGGNEVSGGAVAKKATVTGFIGELAPIISGGVIAKKATVSGSVDVQPKHDINAAAIFTYEIKGTVLEAENLGYIVKINGIAIPSISITLRKGVVNTNTIGKSILITVPNDYNDQVAAGLNQVLTVDQRYKGNDVLIFDGVLDGFDVINGALLLTASDNSEVLGSEKIIDMTNVSYITGTSQGQYLRADTNAQISPRDIARYNGLMFNVAYVVTYISKNVRFTEVH